MAFFATGEGGGEALKSRPHGHFYMSAPCIYMCALNIYVTMNVVDMNQQADNSTIATLFYRIDVGTFYAKKHS